MNKRKSDLMTHRYLKKYLIKRHLKKGTEINSFRNKNKKEQMNTMLNLLITLLTQK